MWGNYIPRDDGVINKAYDGYSRAVERTPQAIVAPLLYRDAPDSMDGNAPYFGTVGIFASRGALVSTDGPWLPNYDGSIPVSEQPHIVVPEPWEAPETGQ